MLRLALLLALTSTACLDAATTTCDDGRLCPAGWACLADGCASPEQVRACDGRADGDACELAGIGAGSCGDGYCQVAVCGNRRVDGAEACDDGNNFSGDGCNATCSSTEACGNGLRDDGEQCDCGDGSTALPDGCVAANGAAGGTCRSDCVTVACGNGAADPGEVCDDGGQTSGDGCSYDCASLEVCGNDYPDFAAGEQCDAGPGRSHDGCGSTCLAEFAAWTEPPAPLALPARSQAQAAFDAGRRRVVVSGGTGFGSRDDTWAWDGAGWTLLDGASPAGLNGAMAYDVNLGALVRVGGSLDGGNPAPPYVFDGTTWQPAGFVPAPPDGVGGRLVWDEARAELVLAGGGDPFGGPIDETWVRTAAGWEARATGAAVPPRIYVGATYDRGRQRVLMLGGYDAGGQCRGELLAFDGTTWTTLPILGGPPPTAFSSMGYDPIRDEVVVVAPPCEGGATSTWRLAGATWTEVPGQVPVAGAMVFDPTAGELLLIGGQVDGEFRDEVLAWTGSGWAPRDGVQPATWTRPMLAYDAHRATLVLVGNREANDQLETWTYDGAAWHLQPTTLRPEPRYGHGLAYDPSTARVVLYGGRDGGTDRPGITWLLDERGWEARDLPGPGPRTEMAMATDLGRGEVILAGGTTAFAPQADSWRFVDGAWSAIGGPQPPGGSGTAMAYAARRDALILAGGELGATWAFDGVSWATLDDLDAALPARQHLRMVADLGRGEVLAIGGDVAGVPLDDVWRLGSTGWREVNPASPQARYEHGVAYDPSRAETVMYGGLSAPTTAPPSWRLRLDVPQPDAVVPEEACTDAALDADGDGLAGCADPDCWARCTPTCVPGTGCDPEVGVRCGDGVCDPAREWGTLCPADCADACGDGRCAPAYEAPATCPADCGACGDGACTGDEHAGTCPGDCAA